MREFEQARGGAEETLAAIVRPLIRWYRGVARDLPWRHTQQPYAVWVSEIMLQQTRVETVKPYYLRFVERYPDVAALSESGDELVKLWEGLGYYSRARNLRRAAVQIAERGGFPENFDGLCRLVGIGPYTAAAVASICFGEPVAAVDGNVLRVVSRLLCLEEDPAQPGLRKEIFGLLSRVMPQGRRGLGTVERDTPFGQARNDAGDFNQAMMELGACVCLPNGAPLCGACPLANLCGAHALGTETSYPIRPEKKARRIEERTVFLIRFGEKYGIRKRPEQGLLAGLWEFPSESGTLDEAAAREALARLRVDPQSVLPLGKAKHVFTHLEWHMTGFLCEANRLPKGGDLIFVGVEELSGAYAIPSALAYFRNLLKEI